MAKFIFIVGGVYSGCGKGISTASMALLMKARNFKVQIAKFESYCNITAGIIRPTDHGEVFVCDDGYECDLDVGSYERIANVDVSVKNVLTSGSLYKELITEQEDGKWLGATIQIVPHVTGKIQEYLDMLGEGQDIVFVEIGGTVGDIESGHYFETIRQFKQKKSDDVIIAMVAPILWVNTIKEFKTKPLQNAVKDLQRFGCQPDMLLCRSDRQVPEKILDKVSNFTNVPRQNIFDAPDVDTIYRVPLELYDRQVDDLIVDKFRLKRNACRIKKYKEIVDSINDRDHIINIGIVGKYENQEEAYLSVKEALFHASLAHKVKVDIKWFNSEDENVDFSQLHGVIIPGGFGPRAIDGKLKAIQYCREKRVPILGICLGLQCAVIEFARNVCNINNANSLEFDKKTPDPVIHYVAGQENLTKKSANMRLGAYDCELVEDSLAYSLYNKKLISERHRHRYEVNPKYEQILKDNGLVVSGCNPGSGLIEMMEIQQDIHPYAIFCQFHPEFKSKLVSPAPLFLGLVEAAIARKAKQEAIE